MVAVTQADVFAANGVIHVIDTVLVPDDDEVISVNLSSGETNLSADVSVTKGGGFGQRQ